MSRSRECRVAHMAFARVADERGRVASSAFAGRRSEGNVCCALRAVRLSNSNSAILSVYQILDMRGCIGESNS